MAKKRTIQECLEFLDANTESEVTSLAKAFAEDDGRSKPTREDYREAAKRVMIEASEQLDRVEEQVREAVGEKEKEKQILDEPISSHGNNIRAWFREPSNWDNKERLTHREVAREIAKDRGMELRKEDAPTDPARPLGKTTEKYVAYIETREGWKRLREFPKEVFDEVETLKKRIPKKAVEPAESPVEQFIEIGQSEAEVPDGLYPVQEVPIELLKLSKEVPNFKKDADASGVVEPLDAETYRRLPQNPITVWERLSGDLEIITGRHRFDLAKRLGESIIPAQVVREADGFTAQMAKIFDAEVNIQDGQGSLLDYANYFREADISRESASSRGLLSRAKGKDGFDIGRHAADNLFALFANGKISGAKAAAIARGAPGNEGLQNFALDYAKTHSPDEITNYLRAIQRVAPDSAVRKGQAQTSLFGADDAWVLEAEAMGRAAAAIISEFNQERSALLAAGKLSKAKYKAFLDKYGISPGDTEAIQSRLDDIGKKLAAMDKWDSDPELFDLVRERAGLKESDPEVKEQQGLFAPPPQESFLNPDELTPYEEIARLKREGKLKVIPRKSKPAVMPKGGIPEVIKGKQRSLFEFQKDAVHQIEMDFRPVEADEISPPKGTPPMSLEKTQQEVGARTTGDIEAAGHVVENAGDVAALMDWMKHEPQELFYGVVTDESGTILEIHKFYKGGVTGAAVYPGIVAGRTFNILGAKKAYLIHNHPSGDPQASPEDIRLLRDISRLMKAKDIETIGLAVGRDHYQRFHPFDAVGLRPIPKAVKTTRIPVKERIFLSLQDPGGEPVTSSVDAIDYAERELGGRPGFVFTDRKNNPIGFLEYPVGRKRKEFTAAVMSGAETLNSPAGFVYAGNVGFNQLPRGREIYLRDLVRFLKDADVQVLDVVAGKDSLADKGVIRELRSSSSPLTGEGAVAEDLLFSRHTPDHKIPTRPVKAASLQADINSAVNTQFQGLKGLVEVVQSESQLPAAALEAVKAQGMEGKYNGFKFRGKIYIVSDNLASRDAGRMEFIEQLLAHEGRHWAFGQILGPGARVFMKRVAHTYKAEVDAFMERHGVEDSAIAAEEVLASQIREGKTGALIDRFIAKVMEWVRKIFPGIKVTKAEVRNLIERAEAMMTGVREEVGVNQFAQPVRFSLKEAVKKITDNPAFVRWFGDSVVTKDGEPGGEPLIVYHGTSEEITRFSPQPKLLGRAFGRGFYFTESRKDAEQWGDLARQQKGAEEIRIIDAYLSIKKPLELSVDIEASNIIDGLPQDFRDWIVTEYGHHHSDELNSYLSGELNDIDDMQVNNWAEGYLRGYAEEYGFDGVIGEYGGTKHFAAFHPTQIKSIFNTTFDPTNPDIRYQNAYHGTPHALAPEPGFPRGRFRLDKIGTGEGSQAYGWGIYFAESEAIGRHYQRMGGKIARLDGKDIDYSKLKSKEELSAFGFVLDYDSIGEAIAEAEDLPYMNPKVLSVIKSWRGRLEMDSGGSIYHLDIPDAVMPKLLDWDAKVSVALLNKLKGAANAKYSDRNPIYKDMVSLLEGKPRWTTDTVGKKKIEVFGSILDGQMLTLRPAERGGFDFYRRGKYAGWTPSKDALESDVKAFEANAKKPTDISGKSLYNALGGIFGSDKQASEFLAEAGIPGNTHGGVSRGATGKKHVIWDQSVLDQISLLKRNEQLLDAMQEDVRFDRKDSGTALHQAISAAGTSLRQVPAAFKKIPWEKGSTNLDIGGGKYDDGTNYLEKQGVENLVYDLYNRAEGYNRNIVERLRGGLRPDTVTANNVLNVIAESDIRTNAIQQAARALKPGGTAYFYIHEGDKTGTGKRTTRGWQNNRKTAEYIDEIRQSFGDVERKGQLIIARNPLDSRPAVWMMKEGDADPILFQRKQETAQGRAFDDVDADPDISDAAKAFIKAYRKNTAPVGAPKNEKVSKKNRELELNKDLDEGFMAETIAGLQGVFNRRGKGWLDAPRDISTFDQFLGLMSHYAEKVPALQRTFKGALQARDIKERRKHILMDRSDTGVPTVQYWKDLRKADKATAGAVLADMISRDQEQSGYKVVETPDGKWRAVTKNAITYVSSHQKKTDAVKDANQRKKDAPRHDFEVVEGDSKEPWLVISRRKGKELGVFDEQEQAWAVIRQHETEAARETWGDLAADTVMATRETLDKGFDMLSANLRSLLQRKESLGLPPVIEPVNVSGEKVTVNIREVMAQMGDIKGHYFPRIRKSGNIMVYADKKGEPLIMKKFDLQFTADAYENKMIRKGYRTWKQKTDALPEDVFELWRKTTGIQAQINEALNRVQSKEVTLEDFGMEAVVETIDGTPELIVTGPFSQAAKEVLTNQGGRWYRQESRWHFKNPGKTLETRLAKALALKVNVVDHQMTALFAASLAEQMGNVIKEHGHRAHMIRRGKNLVVGYEVDSAERIMAQYVSGIAAGQAKGEMAEVLTKAMTGTDIDWKRFQNLAFKIQNDENLKQYQNFQMDFYNDQVSEQEHEVLVDAVDTAVKTGDGKVDYADYQKFVNIRRIDPSKQPKAYNVAKKLSESMLRNQESAERVVGFFKGLAVFKFLAFRVFSAPLINLTALPTSATASMSGYGNIPLNQSLHYLGKGIKAYTNYKRGKTQGMDADLIQLFKEMENNGWDNAQLNQEAFDVLKSRVSIGWGKLIEWGMFTFSKSEQLNRGATISGAYMALKAKARKEGKGFNRDEAVALAKKISDNSHGIYDKANKPMVITGAGYPEQIGQAYYMYRTFAYTYLLTMRDLGFKLGPIEVGKGRTLPFLYMMAAPAILAGAGASVATPFIAAILKGLTDSDDPEEDFYRWLYAEVGAPAERAARFGLFGMAGVNLKGSLEIGLMDVPTKPSELLGAPGSVLTDIYEGGKKIVKGDVAKGIEQIVPLGWGAPIKAYREATEGLTTRTNAPLFHGNEQVKLEGIDAVLRTLAFNPASIATIREQQWSDTRTAAKWTERKRDINARIKKFYLLPVSERTKGRWGEILAMIQEYNERAKRTGAVQRGIATYITGDSIKASLRRSFRPSKRERLRAVTE